MTKWRQRKRCAVCLRRRQCEEYAVRPAPFVPESKRYAWCCDPCMRDKANLKRSTVKMLRGWARKACVGGPLSYTLLQDIKDRCDGT